MIRYRFPVAIDPGAFAAGAFAPAAGLLRYRPWNIQREGGGTVCSLEPLPVSGEWGPWRQSREVEGAEFSVCAVTDLTPWERPRLARLPWTEVELACGLLVKIPAALLSGTSLRTDGSVAGVVGRYANLAVDIIESPPERGDDIRLVKLAVAALQEAYRIPGDAIEALGLLSIIDLSALLEAALAPPSPPKAG